MILFENMNLITIMMIGVFLMPIVSGILNPITGSRVYHSLLSAANSFKFILGILLTGSLYRILFLSEENHFFRILARLNPSFKNGMLRYENDIVAYAIAFFIVLYLVLWILDLCSIPFYRHFIYPMKHKLSSLVQPLSGRARRLWSMLWGIPKAIGIVLLFSLLLSFYVNYVNNPSAIDYINRSMAYQRVNTAIWEPLFQLQSAQNLPAAIYDSIQKANSTNAVSSENKDSTAGYWKQTVVTYFNGVTLDEAVKSNSEIDNAAVRITGAEQEPLKKAYLLYDWVRLNVKYDQGKVEMIEKNASYINSGAIVTYEERKGVCLDYASLYAAMCRAAGIKVRIITGMGYNGVQWGDHAWNQIYNPQEARWVDVDTTFGSSGVNYFDNADFKESHKYQVIQGEWQK